MTELQSFCVKEFLPERWTATSKFPLVYQSLVNHLQGVPAGEVNYNRDYEEYIMYVAVEMSFAVEVL